MIKSFGMIIADMHEKAEQQGHLCSDCSDTVPRWITELEAWRNYQDLPNGEKIDLCTEMSEDSNKTPTR